MLATPTGYGESLTRSHQVLCRLTLLVEGNPIAPLPSPLTLAYGQTETTSVTSPTLNVDATATTMRTAGFGLVDTTGLLLPTNDFTEVPSALIPGTKEIQIERGIKPPGGDVTWFTVGVLPVEKCTITDSIDTGGLQGGSIAQPGPVLDISLSDRSALVSAGKPEDSWSTQPGQDIFSATVALITQAVPWLPLGVFQMDDPAGVVLPPQIIAPQTDPWATAQAWWLSAGYRLFFNGAGNLVTVNIAAAATQGPVKTYIRGDPLNTAAGYSISFDASQAYNGVKVIGSYPGNVPVWAVAWDDDVNSPTYYLGPFGRRPAPDVTSSTATTPAQCYAAAQAILPSVLGLARPATVTCIADGALEPYDVAAIESPPDKISGLWQTQMITLPLDYTASATVTHAPLGMAA